VFDTSAAFHYTMGCVFSMLSAVGIIPARYGSSRLPGKLLADLQGKPLLYYVYQRAGKARSLGQLLIATDDERIAAAARGFGGQVIMTRSTHRSGTDRIAEAAEKIVSDIVVNIQGDEPLIDFSAIDHVVQMLERDPHADMATLAAPIEDPADLWNPNVVKVVIDQRGYATYFSRNPVPYIRVKEMPKADLKRILKEKPELLRRFYRHVGLYGYRSEFLKRFTEWAPSPLELLEDLEQLRAIEHGAKIRVESTHMPIIGVDTPEDLDRIRRLVGKNPELLMA
jgi:3-deoxy-manno-octulosonate cytidylyltransferase (CMP-KDO synthetase)